MLHLCWISHFREKTFWNMLITAYLWWKQMNIFPSTCEAAYGLRYWLVKATGRLVVALTLPLTGRKMVHSGVQAASFHSDTWAGQNQTEDQELPFPPPDGFGFSKYQHENFQTPQLYRLHGKHNQLGDLSDTHASKVALRSVNKHSSSMLPSCCAPPCSRPGDATSALGPGRCVGPLHSHKQIIKKNIRTHQNKCSVFYSNKYCDAKWTWL